MEYKNITKATFVKRPNRFIAEVEIDGKKEIVHVKNTGRCRELLVPGCEVWLTAPGTPDRKTTFDLVAVRKSNGILYNIDSQAPNKVAKEWLDRQHFTKVIPEYTYGDSRIDFYMERNSQTETSGSSENSPQTGSSGSGKINPQAESSGSNENSPQPESRRSDSAIQRYLIEVKGCTLEIDGIGYFPDAPTDRGVKHIRELIKAKADGYNAALAFVIQMDGVSEVRPYTEMHPEFATAMEDAQKAGVDIIFLCCHVEPDSLEIISAITSNQTA
ncbi:sugar fermentation stimulation protein A [Lachnospiraceae bacterium NE2001]|nr:sugar fermentation stimulation protein A [Lachnospiraceae bacterium NE2001]